MRLAALESTITGLRDVEIHGRVAAVQGLMVEIAGPVAALSVGARLRVEAGPGRDIPVEVVGFRAERALCMPFGPLEGARLGCKAVLVTDEATIAPSPAWLGRVIDAMGRPIDGKGPLPEGPRRVSLKAAPPPAHARARVGAPLDLGVRGLDVFLTLCRGQRMGIFAGSGVGKSVTLSMLARNYSEGVAVIGLVGERGREVQEFLEDDLGPEGLARSVVVVATSDEPALMRRQSAYMTLAIAEAFRDAGTDVLCMMDSVTRFAMAQREIGLSTGEPPTTKGYTPTVFSELPRLLERAGPGVVGAGAITGLFTVLVDGDDMNEPVADAVRGILDGHVVMERAIAQRGRYPAINILKSVSRTMPRCVEPEVLPYVKRARGLMATYADMEELIRLGAYRPGTSPEVDEAIRYHPALEAFLAQGKGERTSRMDAVLQLATILDGPAPAGGAE